MNSWIIASMMNYLTKNISELFIVLYNYIAIYSKLARPMFSKGDTEAVLKLAKTSYAPPRLSSPINVERINWLWRITC
jgi:hypothetical protein